MSASHHSQQIDFDGINSLALGNAGNLLRDWFPHGILKGSSFEVGDIHGSAGHSLKVEIRTGQWKDFSGVDYGKDLISLRAAQKHHNDQRAGAIDVAEQLHISPYRGGQTDEPKTNGKTAPNGKHEAADEWEPIIPPPAGTKPPDASALRGFDVVYEYTNLAGHVTHYVRRIDARDDQDKRIIPLTFGVLRGVANWHAKHPAKPLPLYGLHKLAERPDATVLLCEGEKAADAAAIKFPSMICMTWSGGTGRVGHADLEPLQGRSVIVWPDHDSPGAKAALALQKRLPGARILQVDPAWPPGADAADVGPSEGEDPNAWLAAHIPPPGAAAAEPKADAKPDDSELITEDSTALAFTRVHKDDLRFDHDAGVWFTWTGNIWRREITKLAFSWARKKARELAAVSDNFKAQLIAGKASFAAGVERFAQADRAHAVTNEVWNRDAFLLGTPGGTVDLQTGELRASTPDDHISKQTAVAPADTADCPTWLEFLKQATCDDAEMVGFLKRWFGYCLTGDTREHALLFAWGAGGNGKSVLLNTISAIMADYATTAAMDTFVATRGDKHTTDMAMLCGARLVTTTEVDEGQAWDEAKVKLLTGGDPVTARFMRRDNFTFIPTSKLTISGNHKPAIKTVDDAIRRRFNLAPFLFKPENPDRTLPDRLKAEWPGILRWLIDGCLEWQQSGLNPPEAVLVATKDYFDGQDYFARWLEECCKLSTNPMLESRPAALLSSFQKWCGENGEEITDNRWLRSMLEKTPGLKFVTNRGVRSWRGIGLNAEKPRQDKAEPESPRQEKAEPETSSGEMPSVW